MTIQKIDVEFRNKKFQMILEDGMVSVLDPSKPLVRMNCTQSSDLKITTLAGAKKMALQLIEKRYKEIVHRNFKKA